MEFDVKKLADPEFYGENCVPAHSDHVCYRNWEEAKKRYQMLPDVLGKESSFRLFLDGDWKFHYAENEQQTIPGFQMDSYDCKNWADIRVPAHIQMEGYDSPQYANVQYPWDGREDIWTSEIPKEFNPVASYVKYFTLPENFTGERLFISFQGVESGFALWLNGAYVGYSEDSFTPSEFELTPYLREGENKLAVKVFKWTIGSWCEDQDFFRFSGIFRSVFLYTVPKVHIGDIKVRPLVQEDQKTAELKLDFTVMTKENCECPGKIRLKLLELGCLDREESGHGNQKGTSVLTAEEPLAAKCTFSYTLDEPKLWSAEIPYLYELQIEVLDTQDCMTEVFSQRIGFRRFELKQGIMRLNGERIVFKGVNRHEFSSETGRAVSMEETLQDIMTMKQNNINAIRTSHYPNSSGIYELCDRFGIYMIAENNLESHGAWDAVGLKRAEKEDIVPGDNETWEGRMLNRVNSCYQRDKNHPSILIWSCGNESYGGRVIYQMSQKFRELDPDRPVHYEGVFWDRRYNDSSDMESQMYPSVERIKEYLAENKDKPFICCEYTHAMGNSCGAMHKYTDLTDTEPRYQGGFIWDYIDQSITQKDRYGKEFQAYGGDFSDRPTDYNFSGNGICYAKDRRPSPKMQEVKFNYQNISVTMKERTFIVENKNLFADTGIYDCFVLLQEDGAVSRKIKIEAAVPPLSAREFPLPIEFTDLISKAAEEDGQDITCALPCKEYAMTVSFVLREDMLWAKAGHEVAFGQRVYPVGNGKIAEGREGKKPVRVIYGKWNLGVKGENFDALFSYNIGGLVSYRYLGQEMIEKAPMPNFWRAPIDNDYGCGMPGKMAQWKIASLYMAKSSFGAFKEQPPVVTEKEGKVTITYTYYMPTTPESRCMVSYTVSGDGTIEVKLSYDPVETLSDMPEFGMMFQLSADYDRLEWYGLGPEETYADRKHGGKLGIYKNAVADNMAEYLVPQECGNKLGVRYAKVTDARGRGLMFKGEDLSFSALPYTPHELEAAMHPYELPKIHKTVVRVAKAQLGVGGDDSWGAKVHPEYHIDIKNTLELSFCFCGI